MRKKYNLRQGGEYKAECGNYHKKAGDDRNSLQCKLKDDDDNGEDSVENSLGEDIEEDRVDIWHSSP